MKVKPEDLNDCFERFEGLKEGEDRLCTIIFGIYANKPIISSTKDDVDFYTTSYNFIVYSDIIELMS